MLTYADTTVRALGLRLPALVTLQICCVCVCVCMCVCVRVCVRMLTYADVC